VWYTISPENLQLRLNGNESHSHLVDLYGIFKFLFAYFFEKNPLTKAFKNQDYLQSYLIEQLRQIVTKIEKNWFSWWNVA
jgi:hypothetical protein